MASSVNNTVGLNVSSRTRQPDSYTNTELASKVTKKDFSSPTSMAISESMARANYQSMTLSNSKLNELRKYVYKMVATWSMEDKTNIIAQYGDEKLLGGNLREDLVNKQCTETLIINMKQTDLEVLLKDIKGDEIRIKKDVQDIRQQKRKSSGQFNTSTFEEVYKSIESAPKTQEISKYLAAYDESYKVPKRVVNRYNGLKKELETVLKEMYDKIEIAGLAYNLRIEIVDGSDFRTISTQIINKVILYVALIMGKSSNMYALGLIYFKSTIEQLLQYTSYAFIAGIPSVGKQEITELRKQAKLAKARKKEGFRVKEGTASGHIVRQRNIIGRKVLDPILSKFDNLTSRSSDRRERLGERQGAVKEAIRGIFRGDFDIQANMQIGRRTGGRDALINSGRGNRLARRRRKSLMSDIENPLINNVSETDLLSLNEQSGELGDKDFSELTKLAESMGLKGRKLKDRGLLEKEMLAVVRDAQKNKSLLEERKAQAERGGPKALAKFEKQYAGQLAAVTETSKMFKFNYVTSGDRTPYVYLETPKSKGLRTKIDTKDPIVPVYVANQISGIDLGYINVTDIDSNDLILNKTKLDHLLPVYVANNSNGMVTLNSAIKADSIKEPIEYVMPVYVINQMGGSKKNPVTINETMDALDLAQAMGELKFDMGPRSISDEHAAGAAEYGVNMHKKPIGRPARYQSTGIFKGLDKSDPFVADLNDLRQIRDLGDAGHGSGKGGAMAFRVFDESSVIAARMAEEQQKEIDRKNKKSGTKSKNYLAEEAVAFGIRSVMSQPAAPVYVVNGMLDVTTRADTALDKLAEIAKKAAKMALSAYVGPQMANVLGSVMGLATGGTGKAMPRFAQGTNGRSMATRSPVSQFIAGDSLNGKPNEEQVSINWDKQEFQVKPVPSMSKSDLAKNGIAQAQKMSSSDRKMPMAVGISSHTVSYTRDLQFVKEQGLKEAIKVMAVNPGVYDKVEYNGDTMSLMDAVLEMNARLATVEVLLSTGNSQRNAVISNTGATLQSISKLGKGGGSANSAGFPSSLDSILQGQ